MSLFDFFAALYNFSLQGLKDTEQSNFGGGNTAWEEKALGNYATRSVLHHVLKISHRFLPHVANYAFFTFALYEH